MARQIEPRKRLRGLSDGRRARLKAVEESMAEGKPAADIERDVARRFGVSVQTVRADRRDIRAKWRSDDQLHEPGDRRGEYCQRLDDLAARVEGWLADADDEGLASRVRAAEALFKLYQERSRIDGVVPVAADGGGAGPVELHVHLGAGPLGKPDDG